MNISKTLIRKLKALYKLTETHRINEETDRRHRYKLRDRRVKRCGVDILQFTLGGNERFSFNLLMSLIMKLRMVCHVSRIPTYMHACACSRVHKRNATVTSFFMIYQNKEIARLMNVIILDTLSQIYVTALSLSTV